MEHENCNNPTCEHCRTKETDNVLESESKASEPSQLSKNLSEKLLEATRDYLRDYKTLDFHEIGMKLKESCSGFAWFTGSIAQVQKLGTKLKNEQQRTRSRQNEKKKADKRDTLILEIVKLKASATGIETKSEQINKENDEFRNQQKRKRKLNISRLTDTAKELTEQTNKIQESINKGQKSLEAMIKLEALRIKSKYPATQAEILDILSEI